ncbi:hypothetical protein JAAARDRAFT_520034 [Jaapia argillacea MUCL 33604]|uniref:Uncharacterized protein n=1 Tax=Jaapia argillacea MUCL 33604 TaxID=933084 RepID=A0A067QGJ4_9AGAM|nr:hypothetical protein JAAARDRAFT_520034 [Jaapia argillacea MUCL 33604]
MDVISGMTPGTSPSSGVAMISSPRLSLESAPASQSSLSKSVHAPTAFDFKMLDQIKRWRASLSPDPVDPSSAPSLPPSPHPDLWGPSDLREEYEGSIVEETVGEGNQDTPSIQLTRVAEEVEEEGGGPSSPGSKRRGTSEPSKGETTREEEGGGSGGVVVNKGKRGWFSGVLSKFR